MKILMGIIAYAALVATILPAALVACGAIELELHKKIMDVAMVFWFIAAPWYMKKKRA
jgi:hypothetical protein